MLNGGIVRLEIAMEYVQHYLLYKNFEAGDDFSLY